MLTDEDFRALQEQSHLLDELTRHPGWPVLVDYMETVSRAAKLKVLNGQVKSIEEYNALTGQLVGVHKVIDAPHVVRGKVEEELRQRDEAGLSTV